jgi:hypothetical protein
MMNLFVERHHELAAGDISFDQKIRQQSNQMRAILTRNERDYCLKEASASMQR